MARMKPKGTRGRAQVRRLGRTYKTGGFAKIAAKVGGGAKGKRIAGSVFQKMARARKG
jgi:hypothetical protein